MKSNIRKKIFSTIGIIVILLIVLDYTPNYKKRENKFNYNSNERPLVIAHRGARLLFPENTITAFDSSIALGVDLLEMDVRITKDSQLVCLHDESLDRTSNGKGKLTRFSLLVIKQLNFAKNFKNFKGENPYADKIIKIPSLEQVLGRYPNTAMMIELKDKGENGKKAARNLAYLLHKYKKNNDVVISAFDEATIAYFRKITNNKYFRTANQNEIKNFVISQKLFLSKFFRPKTQILAIPTHAQNITLNSDNFISKAHQKGYNIHYWTINDVREMEKLISSKVDGIITDRPDLLIKLLKEKGLK